MILFIPFIVLNKISTFLFNTMNKERVIEKNGYKVNILPIYKF